MFCKAEGVSFFQPTWNADVMARARAATVGP